MRIYLADLAHTEVLGNNQISGDRDLVVPLNVASIASFAEKCFGNLLTIRIFKDSKQLVEAVTNDPPDIVGLSCYIWNLSLNDAVANHIKQLCPDALFIMGGPSIRDTREGIQEFIGTHSFLDIYIMYEAEWAVVEIIREFLRSGKDGLLKGNVISNCAWIKDGELVYGEPNNKHDVDELPSPYLTGWLDPFLKAGFIPLFETNRGCPFACSFCVWGVSALNSVRKYSLERVFAELEYVARKYPEITGWILADANFGMLKRDVEIAARIRDIKGRTPALKNILIWESKNTNARNIEIAKLMGNAHGSQLIAVQTLDSEALEAVQRTNIKFTSMPDRVRELHNVGSVVQTHVMSNLPQETLEGQLQTLRQCFEVGFDEIAVFSTILIPGSEMESAASRKKYGIKTKYRLRQGNCGIYCGVKVLDAEEIIRSTNAITEEETLFLRGVHWLVWYGWNHGFLKPLLKYIHKSHQYNPLDVMLYVLRGDKAGFPRLLKLFNEFYAQARSEWFEDLDALNSHFMSEVTWDKLMRNEYSKAEFIYNSKMILDRELYVDLVNYITRFAFEKFNDWECADVARVLVESRIEVDEIIDCSALPEKLIEIPTHIAHYFVANSDIDYDASKTRLRMSKASHEVQAVRQKLLHVGEKGLMRLAVEQALGAYPNGFVYQIDPFDRKEHSNGADDSRFLERVT